MTSSLLLSLSILEESKTKEDSDEFLKVLSQYYLNNLISFDTYTRLIEYQNNIELEE